MYRLYFMKGACSLATQIIMRELGVSFELVDKASVPDFTAINPVGAVPALEVDGQVVTEGAAIILHLLRQHPDQTLAKRFVEDERQLQDLMFANATMHPAYGRLFFLGPRMSDGTIKDQLFNAVAAEITRLWTVVEGKLEGRRFLGGDEPSPADILLAVYANWGHYFPIDITIGPRATAMIEAVQQRESFRLSQAAEQDSAVSK